MEMTGLIKGIAVVIDDEIDGSDPNIKNIITQIKNNNMPVITYSAIPPDEVVSHFCNVSFVLLDWNLIYDKLSDDQIRNGVRIPSGIIASDNIKFINNLLNICYCPVFIFSNENKDDIITILTRAKLYNKERPNHIFIRSKQEIIGRVKLFREVEKWLKTNPSMYVLKEWEKEYSKSKNKLFIDFQELSPSWPIIMWRNFEDDGVNKSLELGELITHNLYTRMSPFKFSNEIFSKKMKKIDKKELRRVLEGKCFMRKIHDDDISPGDVFKISSKYYLNIRAACDCVPDRSVSVAPIDSVKLYLLKGKKLSQNDGRKFFNKKYGFFTERVSQSIAFPIDDGNFISFDFKLIEIKEWHEVKNNRIGRILPPYINRIQQRYSLYIQRQGLPRVPYKAL